MSSWNCNPAGTTIFSTFENELTVNLIKIGKRNKLIPTFANIVSSIVSMKMNQMPCAKQIAVDISEEFRGTALLKWKSAWKFFRKSFWIISWIDRHTNMVAFWNIYHSNNVCLVSLSIEIFFVNFCVIFIKLFRLKKYAQTPD